MSKFLIKTTQKVTWKTRERSGLQKPTTTRIEENQQNRHFTLRKVELSSHSHYSSKSFFLLRSSQRNRFPLKQIILHAASSISTILKMLSFSSATSIHSKKFTFPSCNLLLIISATLLSSPACRRGRKIFPLPLTLSLRPLDRVLR